MKKIAFLSAMLCTLLLMTEPVLSETGHGDAAERIRPSDYDKAVELYNNGRYEEAISLLKKYIEKKPIPEAYYLIAYSLYKLGRHDEANKYFKYSFMIEPTYSPTPGLEKKHNRPLEVARPEGAGLEPRIPEIPTKTIVVPKLIENRPASDVRQPEPEPAPAQVTPVPPPPVSPPGGEPVVPPGLEPATPEDAVPPPPGGPPPGM